MKKIPVGFLGIYKKSRDALEFFDSGGSVWTLDDIEPERPVSLWIRIFAMLRMIEVTMRFRSVGQCPLGRMKDILRKAVEADDDILTQHQEREDILAKLADTKSVGEVFRLYRWMMKDFRKGPNKSPEPIRASAPR